MSHKEKRGMNGTGRIALVTGAGTGIGIRKKSKKIQMSLMAVIEGMVYYIKSRSYPH